MKHMLNSRKKPIKELRESFESFSYLCALAFKENRNHYIFLCLVLLTIFISFFNISVPILFKYILDLSSKGEENTIDHLIYLFTGYCAFQILGRLIGELKWKLFGIIESSLQKQFFSGLYKRIFKSQYHHLEERQKGNLLSLSTRASIGLRASSINILLQLMPLFLDISFYIIASIYFFETISYPIIIFSLLCFSIYLIISSEIFYKYQKNFKTEENKISNFLSENIDNYDFIKMSHAEHIFSKKFEYLLNKIQDTTLDVWHKRTKFGLVQSCFLAIIVCLVAGISLIDFVSGNISIGTLVFLLLMFFNLIKPLEGIGFLYRETKQSLLDIYLFKKAMPEFNEIEKNIARQQRCSKKLLVFNNVSFTYKNKARGVKNLNFSVNQNGILGITGHSGSGKTTLTKLITGLYTPEEGYISIDGKMITSYESDQLFDIFSVVPQDNALFNASVSDNITILQNDDETTDLTRIIHHTNLNYVIKGLAQTQDTKIGEKGLKLSGGEKQRLSLARALLKQHKILILDEFTSSLDSASENFIISQLKELSKNRLVIIISHNLSTLKIADKILVLNQGELAGFDSHKNLIKNNSIYSHLWNESNNRDNLKYA